MGKRGRKPKPWGPDVLADIARAASLNHLHGWPFGISMMASAAGKIGKGLCEFYNGQRLDLPKAVADQTPAGYRKWLNSLPVSAYLFEGLTLFTESYGLPRWERTGSLTAWLDPVRDANGNPVPGTVRASGRASVLWGNSIPGLVLSALVTPRDGRPLRLSPFGMTLIEEAYETPGAPVDKFESYLRMVTVEGTDVDGALLRIVRDVGIRAMSADGMFLAGRGPERDARGRRVPPLVYVGRNEVQEAKAVIRIAALTSASGIKWLESLGLDSKRADATWSYILDGMLRSCLIEMYDEWHGEGAFGTRLTKAHGDDWADDYAAKAAIGEMLLKRWSNRAGQAEVSGGVLGAAMKEAKHGIYRVLPKEHLRQLSPTNLAASAVARAGADFVALCLFGTYLLARFKAEGIYHPKGGTIRLCRAANCPSPAFLWTPKVTTTGHRTGLYKADPPNYCPACAPSKDADRQKRYREKSKGKARER